VTVNKEYGELNISTFIFDMDGLLFDTERLFIEKAGIVERELGWEVPVELHIDSIGVPIPEVKKMLLARLGRAFPADRYIEKIFGLVYDHIDSKGMPLKPGVRELLKELRDRSMILALASSSFRWMVERNLAAAGLENSFDLTVGGDEVKRGKPFPDIFLLAAERASVDPAACAVLEDSNNGIRAAYAAGMRPVMVPDIKPAEEDVKEMVFMECRDLFEVKNRLDTIILER
jgi:HAD superfamily hydrolase (TIGR01509 family)